MFKTVHIKAREVGLLFKRGDFAGLLPPGEHTLFAPPAILRSWLGEVRVDVEPADEVELTHPRLREIVDAGVLDGWAEVLDLADRERALVWTDGRFHRILGPGLHVLFTCFRKVRVERIEARDGRFEHPQLPAIARSRGASGALDVCRVEKETAGVLYLDGRFVEVLPPGLYAFWNGAAKAEVVTVAARETVLDVSGQELLTADNVTVRLNVTAAVKVTDPRRAVLVAEGADRAIYRAVQLALRAAVGSRTLETLLADRDAVAEEVAAAAADRAGEVGARVTAVGVRDVILPGDMRALMNRVTEARKAAEANLITRREETAAARSQANTARLLADNPALMRLRELETLERIAERGELKVFVGDGETVGRKVLDLM
ncbi:slipin family protein [Alienimonas chondri]|uniref:Band 7 domain-containing protein n=1 Tax=Alienimonas chondri TaxID=2681879 RepID=A0ABX1VDB6_9PLAN|nr:slipin family protein [Alienimonas chondri]NNJ26098.1 hypothetical protein [Alienimonas chondri]